MNYFRLHVANYDTACAHLTSSEDGLYGRLLRWYFRSERAIPNTDRIIFRLARAQTRAERNAVLRVLQEFFVLQADGWHSVMADKEIAWFQEKCRKAKASSEIAVNKRKLR